MPMKTNEREYRNFEIRAKEENEADEKVVRGYASTFNEPYELYSDDKYTIREQIAPEAFNDADMSDVIFQYNHEGKVYARTRNNTLRVDVDEKGLAIEADLGGTEIGRELYEEIKGGYTDRMSFGFRILEDKWEETENRETGKVDELRTITKIAKVYDVSAVSIPANDATSISVRNLSEGVIERLKEERQKALDLKRQRTMTLLKLYE